MFGRQDYYLKGDNLVIIWRVSLSHLKLSKHLWISITAIQMIKVVKPTPPFFLRACGGRLLN